jgi:hypothetical protein
MLDTAEVRHLRLRRAAGAVQVRISLLCMESPPRINEVLRASPLLGISQEMNGAQDDNMRAGSAEPHPRFMTPMGHGPSRAYPPAV